MPQISFTKNNEQVYARFSRLLLEEQLKRGKLTAPQFLDLVLDRYEALPRIIEAFALKLAIGIVEMQINTAKKVQEGLVNPDHIDPDTLADDWAMWIEQQFEEFNKNESK